MTGQNDSPRQVAGHCSSGSVETCCVEPCWQGLRLSSGCPVLRGVGRPREVSDHAGTAAGHPPRVWAAATEGLATAGAATGARAPAADHGGGPPTARTSLFERWLGRTGSALPWAGYGAAAQVGTPQGRYASRRGVRRGQRASRGKGTACRRATAAAAACCAGRPRLRMNCFEPALRREDSTHPARQRHGVSAICRAADARERSVTCPPRAQTGIDSLPPQR